MKLLWNSFIIFLVKFTTVEKKYSHGKEILGNFRVIKNSYANNTEIDMKRLSELWFWFRWLTKNPVFWLFPPHIFEWNLNGRKTGTILMENLTLSNDHPNEVLHWFEDMNHWAKWQNYQNLALIMRFSASVFHFIVLWECMSLNERIFKRNV